MNKDDFKKKFESAEIKFLQLKSKINVLLELKECAEIICPFLHRWMIQIDKFHQRLNKISEKE